jgi:hypothetical protein
MLRSLRSILARATGLLILTAATCLSAQSTIHVGPGQPYTTIQSGITFAATGTSQGTSAPITHTVTINATITP